MDDRDRDLLRDLLSGQRLLSLAVLVDEKPFVGLLPYALAPDFGSVLIHASGLARHTKGLGDGSPFSVLIHYPDRPGADPLQTPRVTLGGSVEAVPRGTEAYEEGRALYLARFPGSATTFQLGDFGLYRLVFANGRLVGGFARATTVTAEILAGLAPVV